MTKNYPITPFWQLTLQFRLQSLPSYCIGDVNPRWMTKVIEKDIGAVGELLLYGGPRALGYVRKDDSQEMWSRWAGRNRGRARANRSTFCNGNDEYRDGFKKPNAAPEWQAGNQ